MRTVSIESMYINFKYEIMIWLVIVAVLLIAAYVAAVCAKSRGVPASISATFYTLKHKAWFLLAMCGTAGMLMPAILEISKPDTEFLAFFACAGMLLVGVAPNFKDTFEGKVHVIGAFLCLLGSQLWVALNSPWCLLVWVVYLIGTLEEMRKKSFLETKPMFWVEIFALLGTFLCVFILV